MAEPHLRTQIFAFSIAILSYLYSFPAAGQEQAVVLQITSPPVIDGYIQEDIWEKAIPITEFTRYLPSEGNSPSGNTEVRFLQDQENLYIGIRVSDTDYQPKARVCPRENINDDDQIGIYIDTVGDARTGYIFYFNPLGIQQDIRYSNGNWFVEWNTIYTSKGHVTENGYEIEVAIPFYSIRYPKTDSTNWKLMVTRKIPDEGAKYAWPELKRSHPRVFMQALPLEGINPPPTGAGIFIQPTISAMQAFEREEDNLIPIDTESWQENIRPSLDFKWGLTPNSGITATINPDFSQIEGDVRQLNLNQRFAFFYPERRPFFLDNIDFFKDQSGVLYTRSIVDPIYGFKLAGREKGIDFGFLNSVDRSPISSVNEKGTPGFSEDELEDTWAINSFGRVRFDAFEQGYVGLVLADKRIVSDPLSTREQTPTGFSNVGGVDISVPFSEIWVTSGYSSFSRAGNNEDNLFGNSSRFSLSRSPDIGLGGALNVYNTTSDYRKEIGFNTQSGNFGISSNINYSSAFGENSFWDGKISGRHSEEYSGNQYSTVTFGQKFNLNGVHHLSMVGGPNYREYNDFSNLGYDAGIKWQSRYSSRFRYEFGLNLGTEIDYELLIPGSYINSSASTTIRPNQRIKLDSSINHNRYTPNGHETESALNTYNRVTWQLSRPWGIRFVYQSTLLSSDEYANHNGSILFTWLQSPGTEGYLGATWSHMEGDFQEQTIFAKYTHTFRH
jgi:hypothetical protein